MHSILRQDIIAAWRAMDSRDALDLIPLSMSDATGQSRYGDFIVIGPNGRAMYIMCSAGGQPLTKPRKYWADRARAAGQTVAVVYGRGDFVRAVNNWVRPAGTRVQESDHE
jgi:hypothetical protein